MIIIFYDIIVCAQGGESNPYQITLSSDHGFHPALDEQARLEAIDHRLQRLLPRSDYESIATTPVSRGQSQQVGACSGGGYVSRYTKHI